MASELILKELQAILLKFTRTRYLQNLTQQNQTQSKFQRSWFPEGVKPKWNFVITLDRNLEISPVIRRMNPHTGKDQIKEKPPSRNSWLLIARSIKVTRIIPRKGTRESNLRKQIRRNLYYYTWFPSFSKKKRKNPLYSQLFSQPFY